MFSFHRRLVVTYSIGKQNAFCTGCQSHYTFNRRLCFLNARTSYANNILYIQILYDVSDLILLQNIVVLAHCRYDLISSKGRFGGKRHGSELTVQCLDVCGTYKIYGVHFIIPVFCQILSLTSMVIVGAATDPFSVRFHSPGNGFPLNLMAKLGYWIYFNLRYSSFP